MEGYSSRAEGCPVCGTHGRVFLQSRRVPSLWHSWKGIPPEQKGAQFVALMEGYSSRAEGCPVCGTHGRVFLQSRRVPSLWQEAKVNSSERILEFIQPSLRYVCSMIMVQRASSKTSSVT